MRGINKDSIKMNIKVVPISIIRLELNNYFCQETRLIRR